MRKSLSLIVSIIFYMLGGFAFSNSAKAQEITPDGTTNTTVNSDGNGNFNIEQGDRAGNNLFHSFDDFSVPTDGSAVFDNAADISNIFSRVTGGNISNIDGLIQANGSANLFLVNPAGIMFGSGARLDIGGSFLGTTADSILFEDGEFSATNLDNPPLLTINAPIGLNLRDNPNSIVNGSFAQNEAEEFVGLEVEPGNNFSLIGGDINFEAGEVTAKGGRVELGGLSGAGTVTIEPNGSLTFPDGVSRANVTFSNAADVDVRESGGSISINANNIDISGGELGRSTIRAGISADSTSTDAQAGNINVNATGTVTISEESSLSNSTFGVGNAGNITLNIDGDIETINGDIFSNVGSGAQGNGGNVTINARSLSQTQGAQIQTSVQGTDGELSGGRGDAGNVLIDVEQNVSISGSNQDSFVSAIFSNVSQGAEGNAGDVEINADSLSLSDGGFIQASTNGQGSAGNISIDADGAVNLNNARIFSTLNPDAVVQGERSTVSIQANSLSLAENSSIITATSGQGDAGNINIDVEGEVNISGSTVDEEGDLPSSVSSDVLDENAVGNAGNIEIRANSLNISEGAFVSSTTLGQGNAGNISIDVEGAINFNDATISNSVLDANAVGDAGNIEIQADSLTISEEASVSSGTSGQGNAGNISIDVEGAINFNDALIFNSVLGANAVAVGNAGNIEIQADSLTISEETSVSSATSGQGNAGNIVFSVDNTVEIIGSSLSSSVVAGALGDAGNIEINAASISLSERATINSSTNGTGDAGNVSISATNSISSLDASSIFSQVSSDGQGEGGEITVNTANLSLTNGSQITAGVFGQGNAGNVTVDANDITFEGVNPESSLSAGIISDVESSGTGNAGNIVVNTERLSLINGGRISSDISGTGDAGNIEINAADNVIISGLTEFAGNDEVSAATRFSRISSQTNANVTGDAGTIQINAGSLTLSDGGFLSISSFGEGNAGDVTIDIGEAVSLNNNAQIFSNAEFGTAGNVNIGANSLNISENSSINASNFGSGTGGNIELSITESIFLRDDSLISAQAFGDANGGNLTIDTNFVVAFPDGNNDIVANAQFGQGGVVNINAESVLGITEGSLNDFTNDINASSDDSTLNGEIVINTSDINPTRGAIELPVNTVEPDNNIARACSYNQDTGIANSFVINGKGGVPPTPSDPLSSESLTFDSQPIANQPNAIATSKGNIIPARGVVKTQDGRIMLVATPTENSSRLPNSSPKCG